MSEHYFSKEPGSTGEEREITAQLGKQMFRFWVDAGVFSKRGVDFGTRLLIETATLPEQGEILDLGCGYGPVGGCLCNVFSQMQGNHGRCQPQSTPIGAEKCGIKRCE